MRSGIAFLIIACLKTQRRVRTPEGAQNGHRAVAHEALSWPEFADHFLIMRIWTIGHSTRTIDKFISLLKENGIKLLADVRSLPGSKRNPQFNKETLSDSLGKAGIRYEHFLELGGRRKPREDSRNMAWRNASFRGYADYMETEEFDKGVKRLLDLASKFGPAAIMCAEAVWWRCHRSLISDYLKARGIEVVHILDASKIEPHRFSSAARIVDGALSYASEEDRLI
jgi:uncharacterized protein (DUF488 family)